jgi:uncharacterized protein YhdP
VKSLYLKVFDWFIIIAAVLIVLFAVLLSFARVFLPHMTQYQPRIEAWASNALHQPVRIGQMQAAWYGLHPEFKFHDVQVLDPTGSHTLIQVDELDIGINLLKSLFHWQIEPGLIIVSGAKLNVRQAPDGKITINGIAAQGEVPSHVTIQDAIAWLFTQDQIYLQNIDVTWYGKNGIVVPLHHVKLHLDNSILTHRLLGSAKLEEATSSHIRFVLSVDGDVLRDINYKARFYLKAKNFVVPPWLKQLSLSGIHVLSGRGDIEIWATWQNQRLQQVQTVFKGQRVVTQSNYFPQSWVIVRTGGNIIWQRSADGWNLASKDLTLHLNNEKFNNLKFNVKNIDAKNSQPGSRTLQINNRLTINPIKNLLLSTTLLSDSLRKSLTGLNPSGEFDNF